MPWSVGPSGEFFDCDESTVVYFDPASGVTHLLGEFAAHLLQQLSAEPMDTDLLVAKLSEGAEDPQEISDLRHTIPEIINELAELDVISKF